MIKKLLLTFLVCFGSYAQESFIVKNDGSKIEFKTNSIYVDSYNRSLIYKTIDRNSEKSISYKELDLVEYGSYKFKSFRLNNTAKPDGFFVISETKDKTLIAIGIPESEVSEDIPVPVVKYVFHVLNKDNTVVKSFNFKSLNDKENGDLRCQIGIIIKTHFKNCEELLARLSDYDKPSDGKNLAIIDFFKKPVYYNCNIE